MRILLALFLLIAASANAASDVATFRFYHALNNGLYAKTRQGMLDSCATQKDIPADKCEDTVGTMAHDFVTYATIRMAQTSTPAKIKQIQQCHQPDDASCVKLAATMGAIQSDWNTRVKPARLKLADYFTDKATDKDIAPIDDQTKKFIVFGAMNDRQQSDFLKASADKCQQGDQAACNVATSPMMDEISAYQVFKFTLERSWDDALIAGKCTDPANMVHKECKDLVAYSAKIGHEFGAGLSGKAARASRHK